MDKYQYGNQPPKNKIDPMHTLIKYLHIHQAKTLHTSFLNILFDNQQLSSASASGKSNGGLFVSAKSRNKKNYKHWKKRNYKP